MRKAKLMCLTILIFALAGCKSKDTGEQTQIDETYSAKSGEAVGTADFSEAEPEIEIKNIVTYVGNEIDYSTGIEVSNAENYEDFQMWVDASAVDIYTVGNYEVIYKFIYGDNTKEVTVIVSVIENTEISGETAGDSAGEYAAANSGSGSNSSNNNSGSSSGDSSNSGSNNSGSGGDSSNNNSGSSSNSGSNNSSSNNNGNSNSGGSSNGGSSSSGGSSNGGSSSGGSSSNSNSGSGSSSNSSTAQTTTAARQIITSSGQSNTKSYSLGYMNIELLSGSVVKIKCTSSKYIVSTRTDISTTTKNNVNYRVYKLIITYNTGAEQVLETYEEKIN